MYKQLIIKLLALAGYNQTTAAAALGYKTQSALQSAIQNKDLKLTVLANICKLCNLDIIITDHNGINISIIEYINQNASAADQQRAGSDQ